MKKDAYYFSHDSNARNDYKIVKLRRKYGIEGYGIYFCIVECLREQSNYTLPIESFEDIAYDLQVDPSKVESIIKDFQLFTIEGNHFYSARLKRSLEEYNSLRNKLSESGKKGGLSKAKARLEQNPSEAKAGLEENPSHEQAGLNQNPSDPQALKERKGKEIKENKKKVNKKVFEPPTLDDVTEYFRENGYTDESAVKAFNFYSSGDWIDSRGNQVKNWKQKMQGVWFKDENKLKNLPSQKTQSDIERYRTYAGFNELLHNPDLGYYLEVDEENKIIRYKRKMP